MADTGLCSWAFFGRASGSCGALWLLVGGIVTMVSLSALCWAVGLYMLCCGVVLILLEVPFLCTCFDRAQPWIERASKVTPFQRGVFYICLAILPWFCIGFWSVFSALLLILTGFLYFMFWLESQRGGKEKPVIRQRINTEDEESLIENEERGSAHPRSEEDKPSYPWDKFMNNVAQQAGEAAATAAATAAVASIQQQATQAVSGSTAPTAQSTSTAHSGMTGSVPKELESSDNPFALE
eukprot:TRINITY_DN12445_c1_g2_i2.p1 TRINITY_DN12445_c1_g2~~TRINITY_DN12445_c1_g2_i2.p1  ORF type:complete len:239 (+),score=32.88 TRINITY_DN12445_c1_g2_i2:194-910(+)